MFEKVFNNGIIKTKDSFLKLLKVYPINYNLKSSLEKEAILNSYRLFLKTCNFDIQILIQSKKEDLTYHLKKISNLKIENERMNMYKKSYIEYLRKVSLENKSSNKEFYIVLKQVIEGEDTSFENSLQIAENKIFENFMKIKDTLSRTGVIIKQIDSEEEVLNLLKEMYQNN